MGYASALAIAPQAAPPSARGGAPARMLSPAPRGNQAQLRRLQAKLKVGSVNDPLEHEADRVADQVMRMTVPAAMTSAPPQISRKCEACEREVNRKCAAFADEEKLQKKERRNPGPHQRRRAPLACMKRSVPPGQPLDAATRAYFH